MKNIIRLFLLGTFFAIVSCTQRDPNKHIDEGKVEDETYSSQKIGWTIQIPKGWEVISRDELIAKENKGQKALEKVVGELDCSGLKHLISFQKNRFNTFISTLEPFKLEYEGEWEDNNENFKNLIYATFVNQGIKADTSSSIATIDGVNFNLFKSTIYAPNGEIILHQEVYNRYMDGYAFGVTINYNNDEDKETMLGVWKNSKFKK